MKEDFKYIENWKCSRISIFISVMCRSILSGKVLSTPKLLNGLCNQWLVMVYNAFGTLNLHYTHINMSHQIIKTLAHQIYTQQTPYELTYLHPRLHVKSKEKIFHTIFFSQLSLSPHPVSNLI